MYCKGPLNQNVDKRKDACKCDRVSHHTTAAVCRLLDCNVCKHIALRPKSRQLNENDPEEKENDADDEEDDEEEVANTVPNWLRGQATKKYMMLYVPAAPANTSTSSTTKRTRNSSNTVTTTSKRR